jgi:prepilin-type N-terminal cleavage/methylation domain-containing protein
MKNSMKELKNTGFTLIELVVTMVIITLLTAALLIISRSGEAEAALLRAAQKLALDISRQQSNALSAKEFFGEIPCGYGIHFLPGDNTQYILFADRDLIGPGCSGQDYQYSGGNESVSAIRLETGIEIFNTNVSDIVFKPPEPQVLFRPGVGPAAITLKSPKSPAARTIIVTSAGQISIQ